jgi:hypothetical protein
MKVCDIVIFIRVLFMPAELIILRWWHWWELRNERQAPRNLMSIEQGSVR